MHGARPTGGTSIWHYTIIRPSAWDSHAERELGSRTSKQSHDRSAVPRRHLPELYESGVTALRYVLITLLGAWFLYYGLKAVQLTEMSNRVWKRTAEYNLILEERKRLGH